MMNYKGALFPALQAIGLPVDAIRRAWAAFRYGAWEIATLLIAWEQYVQAQGQWQPRYPVPGHSTGYDGYTPIAMDTTAFPGLTSQDRLATAVARL